MSISNIVEIITLINTVAIPLLSGALFYSSRKRKAAAEASQEEGKAIATAADGWQKLCEKRDEDVRGKEEEIKAKDSKIDSLYDKMSILRDRISDLESKTHDLQMLNTELEWNRCEVNGCTKRRPPRKREELIKRVEKENNQYVDRTDEDEDI